jgi:DNA-binding IclR family transcriptional regulator
MTPDSYRLLKPAARNRRVTRSVNRALDILEALRDAVHPMSLTELATSTGMDKATTMRIARDLRARGYVELHADTRRYSLGGSILELADPLWTKDSLTQNTIRYLEDLRDKTLQTVALCVRAEGASVVSIELLSVQPIMFSRGVGSSVPLAEDAAGLSMLAFSRGESEPPDVERKTLEKIRDDGYGFSVSHASPRVASVAAPVRVPGAPVDSAVMLSWIVDTDDSEPLARRRYSAQVIGCAQRIARLRQGQGRWRG